MKFLESDIARVVISVLVCQAAGIIGSIPNMQAIPTWYAGLSKPSFTPPNWLFAPAWITLYFLMGIAAFLIWRKGLDHPGVKLALVLFIGQLVFNTLWSFVFFGLKMMLAAFVEIAILWVLILITILKFSNISPVAAILMIPYILWVSYAAALNYAIWLRN